MDSGLRQLLGRMHTMFSSIAHSLRNLFSMTGPGVGSQRMCPFCGLITPRAKRFCLECGKSLRGNQMGRKDARQG